MVVLRLPLRVPVVIVPPVCIFIVRRRLVKLDLAPVQQRLVQLPDCLAYVLGVPEFNMAESLALAAARVGDAHVVDLSDLLEEIAQRILVRVKAQVAHEQSFNAGPSLVAVISRSESVCVSMAMPVVAVLSRVVHLVS